MKFALQLFILFALPGPGVVQAADGKDSPTPLAFAHAHNDYEHKRPLLDALEHGFGSVEADIHLVNGELLVAHDRNRTVAGRTLQTLYLEPLRGRARQNAGKIYSGGDSFILLVDIKSDAEATYAALREVLKQYSDLLTTFTKDATQAKAVTAIISGNRPRQMMAQETTRYAAFDGRSEDLKSEESKHFIPLISENWTKVFKWRGLGTFPAEEKQRLHQFVQQAHQEGRKVRFWAAPDQAAGWQALLDAGVDLINTDHLADFKKFALSKISR
ncbi:MAG: hypothetical protein FJ403_20915 [Verrucomicrobia bacterium]|nr:hypothetical protein [Verrucomicrobiota bacterium]